MAFFFKRKSETPAIPWDRAKQQPAVRRSICTGEMTGGLVDRADGTFHELQLLRDRRELEAFCRQLGVAVEDVKTIY